ncbi:CinA family protein [Aestuariimicrobium ganziense]|uniref:CinA family protein n=1 Tax=Aestuariimicrobium ganziense TaxID=2773677 RepID=UPI00194410AD|nr:CinA family protein [Aestuariimicrobium ganziense]
MTDTVERLVAELKSREMTVATCESLTAGLVAARIADVPGSSAVLRGGLITYATDLKASLAGVDEHWLEEHGVVDETTAVAMASGARHRCGASIGLSCTGVAGPDPQDGVEPGTVWVAMVMPRQGLDDAVYTRRLRLGGDRAQVRRQTVDALLTWLLDTLAPVGDD